jgi:hypothetical protein
MPEVLHRFLREGRSVAVASPHDPAAAAAAWASLRTAMARELHPSFTRDEWAYVMTFLAPSSLGEIVRRTFGAPAGAGETAIDVLHRPRTPVSIWLPSNVSLLGPLTLVVASLSGADIALKAGIENADLTSAFVEFARSRSTAVAALLDGRVTCEQFDRADPRNAALAASARVRIVFGADDALLGVDRLPHPPTSTQIGFGDRRSVAWIDAAAVDDAVLDSLIRVFTIYGQAGCTSPSRVLLAGADAATASAVRDRLLERWSIVAPRDVAMHHATQNIMVRQWAAATGWDSVLAPRNAAVLAVAPAGTVAPAGDLFLPLVHGDADALGADLPANLQTVGHALSPHTSFDAFVRRAVAAGADRIVPLARMHHFGAVWDGHELLRELFDTVEVAR